MKASNKHYSFPEKALLKIVDNESLLAGWLAVA
jgi:hypothetical protein